MTSHPSHPHRPFPVLIGSQLLHQGRIISLRLDEIEVKPGVNVRREVVGHPGAVVVLAVDGDGRILWVRQHRYATGRDLLELPAGTLEHDEAPEACARRELAEEAGVAAAQWRRIGGFFTAPGFCDEYIHAFLATGLSPQAAEGDEDEELEVVPLSLDESLARIDAGEIEDAKSIAAVLYYLRQR